jgi:hypothetical protein
MFVFFLILNFCISWYNARTVGRVWSESKQIGGMLRVNAVIGYAMSIIGFTMVYGCVLLMALPSVLPMFVDLSQAELYDAAQLSSDLLYLLVGAFIIPTGFGIWFSSMMSFGRRRSFGRGMRFGWNTYAQMRNTINYMRAAPSAFGRVIEAFGGKKSGGSFGRNSKSGGKKKNDGVIAIAALLVVALAVCGGWFTASTIMKRADAKYDSLEWLGFPQPQEAY